MEKIFIYLKGEWEVFFQAPFSFLIFGTLAFGLAHAISSYVFKNKISNKDATIQLLNATIQSIDERAKLDQAKLNNLLNNAREDKISLELIIGTLEIEYDALRKKFQDNQGMEKEAQNGDEGNGKTK